LVNIRYPVQRFAPSAQ
jgi:hypothetical protein